MISQNVGPMVQIFMLTEQAANNGVTQIADPRTFCQHCDRDRFRRFAHLMISQGVYMSPAASLHSIVSTQTTDADIDLAIATAREVAPMLA